MRLHAARQHAHPAIFSVLIQEFVGNEIRRTDDPSLLNCILPACHHRYGRWPGNSWRLNPANNKAKKPSNSVADCFLGLQFVSDENGLKSRAEIAFAVSHFMHVDAKVQGLF